MPTWFTLSAHLNVLAIYSIFQRKANEKKKLNPYSRADLLAHFKGFRTNQKGIVKKQRSIVKQMKRQMKELKGIEKGAAELTKQ